MILPANKSLPITAILCMSLNCQTQADEHRIDKLLLEMSLGEKIGQLNQIDSPGPTEDLKSAVRSGSVGSILNEVDPSRLNEIQRVAVEQSRHGIPLLFARDVIHGFKTIFPIPLGQAATWDPSLAEACAHAAAVETSSTGIRWTFAPMIDVTRDPRWGRIAESCGEDPFLTSSMGVAMIRGFQGEDLSKPTSIAACAKHFAGYGAVESGKDYNTTWIPELQLREVHLPSFHAACNAGVASFMCSFNDINGTPSSANAYLNRDILRKEWKYKGVLVSDWASIQQMIPHGVCSDLGDAAQKAANAGVDMDMMSHAYSNHLESLVSAGTVSPATIDELVRRVLRMKFQLGLFDHPYADLSKPPPFYTRESLALAEQTAVDGAVLLKNHNATLPLDAKRLKSIAVVGPLSDSPADQLGTWVFDAEPEHSVTPLQAIRAKHGKHLAIHAEKGLTYSRDRSMDGIRKAVQAAEQSDVVLFFAGEEAVISGEARCRADISLPGAQSQMLDALKATGKPVVLILMSGRPLTVEHETSTADAVLLAFHGGTMAGPALERLLFGEVSPSGKLPVTFPRMTGQIPIYYAHKNTGRPTVKQEFIDDIPVGAPQTSLGFTSNHLDAGTLPLFPFGFGLSYTKFDYSAVKLSASVLHAGETITATCVITNTGTRTASEVAQLYLRDPVASLARPVRELKGFQKISLKPGESKTVTFAIQPENLAFWHDPKRFEPENGTFQLWIAKDSQSGTPVEFTLQ